MNDISIYIILILFCLILFILSICYYAKKKDTFEEVSGILVSFVFVIIYIIYFTDMYNIPTKLGWLRNMSSDRWFNYINNYSSSIVGAVIGGIIVVFVTRKQIDEQNKNYKDDKRIQNAPIFDFKFSNVKVDNSKELYLFNDSGNTYCLFLRIENIGFNHARNVTIFIDGDNIKDIREFKLDDSRSILKKNDFINLKFIFNYKFKKSNNLRKINITIKYDDLLENKYSQKIVLKVEPTQECSSKYEGNKLYISGVNIESESLNSSNNK